MKYDLDRRIANAVKRVHARIDEQAGEALWLVGVEGDKAREVMNAALQTAARSIGQFRRHRNKATDYSSGTSGVRRPSADGG